MFFLSTATPILVRSPNNTLLVQSSGRVVLTCEGRAAPTPDITWMRDGVILTDDANINIGTNIVTDSQRNKVSTLTVSSFTMSDEGNYACNVSNTARSVVSGGLLLGKCWVIKCLMYMYTQPMWLSTSMQLHMQHSSGIR